jgi:hypothetical protein
VSFVITRSGGEIKEGRRVPITIVLLGKSLKHCRWFQGLYKGSNSSSTYTIPARVDHGSNVHSSFVINYPRIDLQEAGAAHPSAYVSGWYGSMLLRLSANTVASRNKSLANARGRRLPIQGSPSGRSLDHRYLPTRIWVIDRIGFARGSLVREAGRPLSSVVAWRKEVLLLQAARRCYGA